MTEKFLKQEDYIMFVTKQKILAMTQDDHDDTGKEAIELRLAEIALNHACGDISDSISMSRNIASKEQMDALEMAMSLVRIVMQDMERQFNKLPTDVAELAVERVREILNLK
jgi:hypothetical protein